MFVLSIRYRAKPEVFMPISPRSVLIIDDKSSIHIVVAMVLEDEGYVVRTASNGATGLEMLESWTPDIILLDVRMPVMDGWTFLQIYQQRAIPHAPIIACAADADIKERILEAGAVALLHKPFDLDVLVGMVEQHIRPEAPLP